MKSPLYQEALDAFVNPFHEVTVQPIAGGLINLSYKVTSMRTGISFLLQRINDQIFSEPAKIQANYEMLCKYLEEEQSSFVMPELKYFPGGANFFQDSRDHCWRVFEFIPGTRTHDVAENMAMAKMVAATFGRFTASFANFQLSRLHISIPAFHNLSYRYRQFQAAQKSTLYERLIQSAPLVSELKAREHYVNLFDVLTESPEFHQRVMHHDAKISNVLFDEDSGNIICPVDFDTVMPGYIFSDLGDMIRSMASCRDENSTDLADICIRKDLYEAIVSGYLEVMEQQLTAVEKKYLHFAGIMMIYMQALRFLSDYLDGDRYYKSAFPGQNFDRASNQLELLKQLEEFLHKNYQFKV